MVCILTSKVGTVSVFEIWRNEERMCSALFDVARQVVVWSFLLENCVLYDCDI